MKLSTMFCNKFKVHTEVESGVAFFTMINEHNAQQYCCDDISKIENY